MKKLISLLLAVILVLPSAFAAKASANEIPAEDVYASFAEMQLGKSGAEILKEYGINFEFEWCVWFTTMCAYNTGFCSSVFDTTYNVFPPLDRNSWEECGWAATGVTYQVNRFARYDKGTIFKFLPDSRISSDDSVINTYSSCVIPERGNLIYFDWEKDKANGSWDHVAIVTGYNAETDEITFVGGNQGEEDKPYRRHVTEKTIPRTSNEYAGLMKIDFTAVREEQGMTFEAVNAFYRITSDTGVRLRSGYGLSCDVLDTITFGAEVLVTEKTAAAVNGYVWGHTFYGGKSGWFAMKYSEKITRGDANGDGALNTGDAVCILRYAAGLIGEGELSLANADVNRNGTVNTADATYVLGIVAGKTYG